jgi:hypothetical protein
LGFWYFSLRLTPRRLAATQVPRNANFAKLKAGYLFPEVCAQYLSIMVLFVHALCTQLQVCSKISEPLMLVTGLP